MPWRRSSLALTLVSSQRIASAAASVARARKVMSAALPMGVATMARPWKRDCPPAGLSLGSCLVRSRFGRFLPWERARLGSDFDTSVLPARFLIGARSRPDACRLRRWGQRSDRAHDRASGPGGAGPFGLPLAARILGHARADGAQDSGGKRNPGPPAALERRQRAAR